jgi:predicted 3-demethylubiquinone-9 3-methyltransferase (glyoxalase superfamily)
MQKITPFLWFDNQAEEAVNFYTSIFKDSKIASVTRYGEEGAEISGRPKGSVMTVEFELEGQKFVALNGGPYITFSPAISFFVSCKTEEQTDRIFNKLSEGGMILMELDKYPFSKRYGWVQDKFGVSWQLNFASRTQIIAPFLMFVGEQHGKAEDAMNFYGSLFKNSDILSMERYGRGEIGPEGTVKHAAFSLDGQEFMAIDSSWEHQFTFTPAISFVVNCETQEEVDVFWEKLSEGGEKHRCAWLKDKYGVSWQIVPSVLLEMLKDKDAEKAKRVMHTMLQMDKIDIKTLKQTYEQK